MEKIINEHPLASALAGLVVDFIAGSALNSLNGAAAIVIDVIGVAGFVVFIYGLVVYFKNRAKIKASK